MASSKMAIFMSRMLQDFPKQFQWVPKNHGGSTRHTCDTERNKFLCIPWSESGLAVLSTAPEQGIISLRPRAESIYDHVVTAGACFPGQAVYFVLACEIRLPLRRISER